MVSVTRFALLSTFTFVLLSFSNAELKNVYAKRTIAVTSHIAIAKTTVKMKNEGSESEPFFYLSIKKTDADGLGDLWVSETSKRSVGMSAFPMEVSDQVPGLHSCCTGYKVMFPKPLEPGTDITVDIRMDIAGAVKMVPDSIRGLEDQYIRYEGSSYFYSPYKTKAMETTLILGSEDVTSKKGLIEPFEQTGKRFKMGTYKDVDPLSYNAISLRFKHNKGFLVGENVIRQYYVSHWGSIAAKEEYKVTNAAAKHEGEWSRVDHASRFTSKYGTALGDVWANLPEDATRVVYKDLIGNVTSSHLRQPSKGKRPVQLTFRFPLMGGWHNHFWITYDLILGIYAKSKGSEHMLTLPVFPSLDADILCEVLELRILLPEWSHGIEVVEHPSLKFEAQQTVERTTLTLFGRPVLSLKLKMIRSLAKHGSTVRIRYKYNTSFVWVTPVIVAAFLFFVFISFIAFVRNGIANAADDRVREDTNKLKSS